MKLLCEVCNHQYEAKPGYFHECRDKGRIFRIHTQDLWSMLLDRLCAAGLIVNLHPKTLSDLWLVHKDGTKTQMGKVKASVEWLKRNWEKVQDTV